MHYTIWSFYHWYNVKTRSYVMNLPKSLLSLQTLEIASYLFHPRLSAQIIQVYFLWFAEYPITEDADLALRGRPHSFEKKRTGRVNGRRRRSEYRGGRGKDDVSRGSGSWIEGFRPCVYSVNGFACPSTVPLVPGSKTPSPARASPPLCI